MSPLESPPSTTLCLSPLLHKLFPAHSSRRNWKLPKWKLHHTAVFACSLLQHWLSTTKRGKKKTQIPPKSASSTFSLTTIPLFAKHPAGAAASHQPVSLYCFSREKYMGLKKKKNHLLQTCCRTSSKQFAGAWQLP